MSVRLLALAASILFSVSAMSAGAQDLFVVCQDDAALVRLDTFRGEVTARVSLPPKPAMIAAARGSGLLFVTHPELGVITRLEVANLGSSRSLTVGGTPFGVVADAGFIYVGDWKANVVRKLDAETGAALAEVPVGREPAGLALDPRGKRLFVANRESRSVTVIELDSMRATKEIAVGEGPFAIAFDGARERLFVANVRSADVTVIDAAAERVVANLQVGGAPYGLAVDPESDRLLVTSQHGDHVSLLNADRPGARDTIPVGRYPEALAVWEGKAFVANWFSGDLSILELATRRQIATIKLGEGPRSMALAGAGNE